MEENCKVSSKSRMWIVKDGIHKRIILWKSQTKANQSRTITELAFSHNINFKKSNLLIADTRNRPFLTSKIKELH